MKFKITKGHVIVDPVDADLLESHTWYIDFNGYAERRAYKVKENGIPQQNAVYMHRAVAERVYGALGNHCVDHINRNKHDNRRSNLRLCSMSQNLGNSKIPVTNKSGYKGVCWHKQNKKWHVQIKRQGVRINLGFYSDIIEAAHTYDNAAREVFGEFARVNFPREGERGCR